MPMMSEYKDRFGGLHHIPVIDGDPETSENAPLYSSTEVVLAIANGVAHYNLIDAYLDYLDELEFTEGVYRTTPGSTSERFSHDNMTGILAALYYITQLEREPLLFCRANERLENIKFNFKSYAHPRDIFFYFAVKFDLPFLTLGCLPFEIISCWQTYKKRGGRKIEKTDGKILALVRHISMDQILIVRILMWIIKRKRSGKIIWPNCESILLHYFQQQPGHPNVSQARIFDKLYLGN
jgi:hypothetical protein